MDRVPLFTRPNPDYEAAYDVFHKQGASRILWGEISKILCSWFFGDIHYGNNAGHFRKFANLGGGECRCHFVSDSLVVLCIGGIC